MIVLSRRPLEAVVIFLPDGRQIEVVVTQVSNGKTRLGFTAPPDVVLMRKELLRPLDGIDAGGSL